MSKLVERFLAVADGYDTVAVYLKSPLGCRSKIGVGLQPDVSVTSRPAASPTPVASLLHPAKGMSPAVLTRERVEGDAIYLCGLTSVLSGRRRDGQSDDGPPEVPGRTPLHLCTWTPPSVRRRYSLVRPRAAPTSASTSGASRAPASARE